MKNYLRVLYVGLLSPEAISLGDKLVRDDMPAHSQKGNTSSPLTPRRDGAALVRPHVGPLQRLFCARSFGDAARNVLKE